MTSRHAVAFVGPILSTWDDAPPYHHLRAIALSMKYSTLFAHQGPCVPGIPLSPHADLGWQRDFLHLGQAQDLAVDLSISTHDGWQAAMQRLVELETAFRELGLRLVAHGPFTAQKLENVVSIWGHSVLFVSRGPIDYANRGQAVQPDLTKEPSPKSDRQALQLANVAMFEYAGRMATRSSQQHVTSH